MFGEEMSEGFKDLAQSLMMKKTLFRRFGLRMS